MSFKELDFKRQIILDHYENPTTKLPDNHKVGDDYLSANNNSPSCIDNLTAFVKIVGNKIQDIKFQGIGCAIATSSTDIMSQMLVGKTKTEANKFIDNYLNMIDGKKYDAKVLKELEVFANVNKQINRIKCAKVGIQAIQRAINGK
jgi:nitrogen fixation NifU-like protein